MMKKRTPFSHAAGDYDGVGAASVKIVEKRLMNPANNLYSRHGTRLTGDRLLVSLTLPVFLMMKTKTRIDSERDQVNCWTLGTVNGTKRMMR